MERYANRSGDSGVAAYELGPDSITIQFSTGTVYLYNSQKPGADHVRHMQQLAVDGRGLNSYIGQHVRDDYAEKWD